MNLVSRVAGALGFVRKAAVPRAFQALEGEAGGWHSLFARSPFDFDRDIHVSYDAVLSNWTVFSCMTLIAGDVGKMRPRLMQQQEGGIWAETTSNAFSPVLRKPNEYQTWQKFIESWMLSKLSRGNTYVLKERDDRKVVVAMHVLDPDRVTPAVTPEGEVFYRLNSGDDLAGIRDDQEYAPAREIIHDRMWCLFHPLIGLSPLFACGLAATQGLSIQRNSAIFFSNMSRPSGVLTTPGFLTNDQADTYKERWETKYGAGKQGGTAILGNGLVYNAIGHTAEDSQLVDQLKMSAEMICSAFHVPGYKVGVGPLPPYQSAAILNQIYYDDCLQTQIEGIEALLDDGLGLTKNIEGKTYGIELDLDALLRMDEGALTDILEKQLNRSMRSPDEARKRLNLPPVPNGAGKSPMSQQQNFSLEALSERDKNKPFAKPDVPAATTPAAAPADMKAISAVQIAPMLDMVGRLSAAEVALESLRQAKAAEADNVSEKTLAALLVKRLKLERRAA